MDPVPGMKSASRSLDIVSLAPAARGWTAAPIEIGRAGGDAKREMLRHVQFRPGQPQIEARRPDARRGERDRHRSALMRVELDGFAHRIGLRDERAVDVEIELVVAGFAFDIVDVDVHLRAVAKAEETGQGARHDDRIAHDHFGFRAADFRLRPGGGHDAHGAVEGGQVERHFRLAIGVDAHHAGIKRERLLRRQIALDAARCRRRPVWIAPADAFHAVDQQAVEIADFDRQFSLAEEIILRDRAS